ncbi:VOC family protein [soil metagenome]
MSDMAHCWKIGGVTLVVDDYDRAIAYYCGVLGFEIVQDIDLGGGKRWVCVGPRGAETSLLLAKATTADQESRVGNQTGGRVFLFLHTRDFHADYQHYKSRGVVFLEEPREEAYATVAVFQDLYGNKWDLLQMKACE